MTLIKDFNCAAKDLIDDQFVIRLIALRDKECHKCRKICLERSKTDKLDPSFVKACKTYCILPTEFLFYLYFKSLGKALKNKNIIDYCDCFYKNEAKYHREKERYKTAIFLESFATY